MSSLPPPSHHCNQPLLAISFPSYSSTSHPTQPCHPKPAATTSTPLSLPPRHPRPFPLKVNLKQLPSTPPLESPFHANLNRLSMASQSRPHPHQTLVACFKPTPASPLSHLASSNLLHDILNQPPVHYTQSVSSPHHPTLTFTPPSQTSPSLPRHPILLRHPFTNLSTPPEVRLPPLHPQPAPSFPRCLFFVSKGQVTAKSPHRCQALVETRKGSRDRERRKEEQSECSSGSGKTSFQKGSGRSF